MDSNTSDVVSDIGLNDDLLNPPQQAPPLDLEITIEGGRTGPTETRRATVCRGGRAWVFDVVISNEAHGAWRAYLGVLDDRGEMHTTHVKSASLAMPPSAPDEIVVVVVNAYFRRHAERLVMETRGAVHMPNYKVVGSDLRYEIVLLASQGVYREALIRDGDARYNGDWMHLTFEYQWGGLGVNDHVAEEELGCWSPVSFHVLVPGACEQAVRQYEWYRPRPTRSSRPPTSWDHVLADAIGRRCDAR